MGSARCTPGWCSWSWSSLPLIKRPSTGPAQTPFCQPRKECSAVVVWCVCVALAWQHRTLQLGGEREPEPEASPVSRRRRSRRWDWHTSLLVNFFHVAPKFPPWIRLTANPGALQKFTTTTNPSPIFVLLLINPACLVSLSISISTSITLTVLSVCPSV